MPLLAALSLAHAGDPVPTVIVDIHDIGHAAVESLRRHHDVRWSAEFGNELLLGVGEEALPAWLNRTDVRLGPPRLAFDEVVVRDHACPRHDQAPALTVVGGFEILRRPPPLARALSPALGIGRPLPADGVVSREVRNSVGGKQARVVEGGLQASVSRVDGMRWFTTMSELAAFDRNSFSSGIHTSHDWILAHFEGLGLDTGSHAFTLGGSGCASPQPQPVGLHNPYALRPGDGRAHEWIVIGAHYDSRNQVRCDGGANPQPGANDNASGCAGVIELARVFARVPTERSLLFICFAGEEQGLAGSYRFVEFLIDSGDIDRVQHMINLDMIGHAVDSRLDARVETNSANAGLLLEYAAMAATYAPELNLITSSTTQAYSDHWPFLAAGVPSVFTWENGAGIYPYWHHVDDVPANMQFARELASGILKMDAAMLAQRAGSLAVFFGDFEARE
ncbi:MAG TPA: M28 family peptidase [Xanthomonadaceae bacterium]|nr:M28 family peptidase [Xanthomonadaceae bacterium]